jgi:integrase
MDEPWPPGRHSDGAGLYLQIGPSGGRSWIFRFKQRGRTREMGLGAVHTIALPEARDLARACRRLVYGGIDPIAARSGQGGTDRARLICFSECAEEYLRAHGGRWTNAKHAAQWRSTLRHYCYAVMGDAPVADINSRHVLAVLQPIWGTRAETASRVRSRIEAILDWATEHGYRTGPNPARWRGQLDQVLCPRSRVAKPRPHAALPFAEVEAFMARLREQEGIAARALEFALITAARSREILEAKWADIDLETRVWIVTGDARSIRPRTIPLSCAAVQVLESLSPGKSGDCIFPGRGGHRPLSGMACPAVLKRMQRTEITVHGFRTTFREWAARQTNYSREVVEAALGNFGAARSRPVYEPKPSGTPADLMEDWGQFLMPRESPTTRGGATAIVSDNRQHRGGDPPPSPPDRGWAAADD